MKLQFLNSATVRNTLKLASSNVLMYLLPIVVTPILTRIYDPSYFGEWGVFSGLFSIINVVLFLCLENAIVKSEKSEYISVSIVAFLISLLVISIVIILFFIGDSISFTFLSNFPGKAFFIIYLLLNAFYTIFFNIANKNELYWTMSIGSIVTGLCQAALRILFGFMIIFNNGLIAGTVFAQFIATVFFLFYCFAPIIRDIKFNNITISALKNIFKKYKKFPLYDAPATLLAFSAFNLPVIILSLFFDKSEIGCYSVILQLLLLPMSFIGTAIGKVYYQEISKTNSDESIQYTTKKIVRFTSIVAILPMLFLLVGGDKLVAIFLGDSWTTSGNIAISLSLWSVPTILTQPIVPLYRALNKQKNMLYFNSAYFIAGIGALSFLCLIGCNIYHVLLVYAVVCCGVKLSMFINLLQLSKVSLSKVINSYVLILYILTLGLFAFRIVNILTLC